MYVMLYSDIFYINDSLAQPSLNTDYLPVVFAMAHGSTKTLTDCQKYPLGWVMLKSFILYDWVTRFFQRLNHPNRITCHKAGLGRQPPQPVTPLTATPGKAASTAVSGIVSEKLDTSHIFKNQLMS